MLKQWLMNWVLRQQRKKRKVSPDYNVETYLNKIVEYFDAEKAGSRSLTVVYEFHDSGDNDGSWTVTIADGKCTLSKGAAEQCESRFYMTADTYRRILTGYLEISKLTYSTGAIRFIGNTLAHRELNEYLTIPKNAGIAAL